MRLIVTLLSVLALVACSTPPREPDLAVLDAMAQAAIRAVPLADPPKYRGIHDVMKWANPYLLITRDRVDLVDYRNHEVHHLRTGEMLQALGKLPPSAWPYGRVVAASENGVRSAGDDALIRRNRGIVAGTLEGLQVHIEWFPAS
jgi:hypothetical protein